MHWLLSETQGHYELEAVKALPTALMYGYSVYTTFRWPLAEEWLNAHLARLKLDAGTMNIQFPWDLERLKACIARYQNPKQPVVRITVTPEVQNFRELLSPDVQNAPPKSQLFVSLNQAPPKPNQLLCLKSMAFQDPLAQVKHGSMAEKLRLRRDAVQEGYDDVVFVNQAGYFSEASTSNIFFILHQQLYTPEPARDYCLPGITRKRVLAKALKMGISTSEQPVALTQLDEIDGAFLSNAVLGIQKMSSINKKGFPWPESTQSIFETLYGEVNR